MQLVDPKSPWKLPRLNDPPILYGYTKSATEWQALLDRAKDGDCEAEFEVACCYEDGCKNKAGGTLVRRSTRKAVEWFWRAARHGSASAQNAWGILLGNGDVVQKNSNEALRWLRKAYRAGEPWVAINIAITHREMGNFRRAVYWFRRCVAAGDDDALIELGIHYYWGKGVQKNPSAAVRCFRKATKGTNLCEASRDDAFFYLGIAFFEGRGVSASIRVARRLFQRANVDNDHPAAFNMLQMLADASPRQRRIR